MAGERFTEILVFGENISQLDRDITQVMQPGAFVIGRDGVNDEPSIVYERDSRGRYKIRLIDETITGRRILTKILDANHFTVDQEQVRDVNS